MTIISPVCARQVLQSPRSVDSLTDGAEAKLQLTEGRCNGAVLNLDGHTAPEPPHHVLSYALNISYARPIVLSCTALHGGHQTMKWGV